MSNIFDPNNDVPPDDDDSGLLGSAVREDAGGSTPRRLACPHCGYEDVRVLPRAAFLYKCGECDARFNRPLGVDGGKIESPEAAVPSKPKRQVSIERLEQLIAKWREKADDLERMHLHPQAKLTRDRADDLEALTRQETEK